MPQHDSRGCAALERASSSVAAVRDLACATRSLRASRRSTPRRRAPRHALALACETVGRGAGSCSTCCSATLAARRRRARRRRPAAGCVAAFAGRARHRRLARSDRRDRRSSPARRRSRSARRRRASRARRRDRARGVDVIKDDHGLADQASAPFAARDAAVQCAIDAADRAPATHRSMRRAWSAFSRRCGRSARVAHGAGRRPLRVARWCGVSTHARIARYVDALRSRIRRSPRLGASRRRAARKVFEFFSPDPDDLPQRRRRFVLYDDGAHARPDSRRSRRVRALPRVAARADGARAAATNDALVGGACCRRRRATRRRIVPTGARPRRCTSIARPRYPPQGRGRSHDPRDRRSAARSRSNPRARQRRGDRRGPRRRRAVARPLRPHEFHGHSRRSSSIRDYLAAIDRDRRGVRQRTARPPRSSPPTTTGRATTPPKASG